MRAGSQGLEKGRNFSTRRIVKIRRWRKAEGEGGAVGAKERTKGARKNKGEVSRTRAVEKFTQFLASSLSPSLSFPLPFVKSDFRVKIANFSNVERKKKKNREKEKWNKYTSNSSRLSSAYLFFPDSGARRGIRHRIRPIMRFPANDDYAWSVWQFRLQFEGGKRRWRKGGARKNGKKVRK